MKVSKLIEELQKLDGNAEVYVSGDGIHYELVVDIEVDDEDDVLISGFPQGEF